MVSNDRPVPNAALLKECRAAFDWWERLASSRPGYWLIFLWACAEATFWPIVPDFLLVPLAAANRRRFHRLLASAILGLALGGTLIYLFAYRAPGPAAIVLGWLPLVNDRQIAAAQAHLAAGGVAAFLYQPWSGVPFKVWAVEAGAQGLPPYLVIPTFIVARAIRLAIWATLARVLAGLCAGFVRDFSLFLALIYVVLFFYGWWQVLG